MSLFCRCKRTPFKTPARPYKKCVLIGNWFEERAMEEEIIKDYLYKREHGELNWQKLDSIKQLCLKPVSLSRSSDPYVRYGNRIMLINYQLFNTGTSMKSLCIYVPDDTIYVREITDAIIDLPPKSLSASTAVMKPTAISTFVIRGHYGSQDGTTVRYGDTFYLYSSNEKLLMMSLKRNPLFKNPHMSPNNRTALVVECAYNCTWKAMPYDPRERLELEGEPIMANTRLLLNHVESNQNLCVEEDFDIRTPFGTDKEVSCKTKRICKQMEDSANHWVMFMDAPGKDQYPIEIEDGWKDPRIG